MTDTKKDPEGMSSFNLVRFILACLRGDRSRRAWISTWLRLPGSPRFSVSVKRNLRAPMADGVCLTADHYFPKTSDSSPTILIRSIWGRAWYEFPSGLLYSFVAQRFAERGYHVILQTVRATSPINILTADEAADGQATIAWIARQPWFQGQLGMWGLSYLGFAQWAALKEGSLFLQALVPGITTSWFRSLFYQDDVFALQAVLVVLSNLALAQIPLWKLFPALRRQQQQLTAAYAHLPLLETVQALGIESPPYQQALHHPQVSDPYWQTMDYRASVTTASLPIHFISGWYDIFIRDLLTDYDVLKAAGHNPYLTIGPWGHLSAEGGMENIRESLAWFDVHLRGETSVREHPVRIYVMGTDQWLEMESWPPLVQPTTYYLHESHRLSQEKPAQNEVPDQYQYDPADPTPSIGGVLLDEQVGQQDNAPLENRPDVLSYTSEPFKHALTVMGTIQVILSVHSTAISTDFFGRVCDVSPQGRSLNVTDGLLRLRSEDGDLQPDGSRQIKLALWPTAHSFQTGHRLRFLIASGAHPRWARNPGTDGPIASETKLMRANQTIYHDSTHMSTLILPVKD